jgi:predicted ATPase
MLIVLDNCEHVIAKAAEIAEILLKSAPGLRILATSRERLRARGEAIHRLPSLSVPAQTTSITAAEALTYSSVQLFAERTAASFDDFVLTDAVAPVVCEICRRLDGVPLALELAAAQVGVIGLQSLAQRLENRFAILTKGRRTAFQRQQTLRATMDWSHDLLSEGERVVLRRLAAFRGDFTMEAASAVASDTDIPGVSIIEGIANLATKSLVTTDIGDDVTWHRLLETTRIYAGEKLEESGEANALRRRHAVYFLNLFEGAEQERAGVSREVWLATYARSIDNVRVALEWAFSQEGDQELGISLTAAVVTLLIDLSLLTECRQRTERALAVASDDQGNASARMRLYAGLAWSLMYGVGRSAETAAAWQRTLELAEALNDVDYRRRALSGLCIDQFNNGNVRVAVSYAEQLAALSDPTDSVADRMRADRVQATALHYLGDQRRARHHIDRALAHSGAVEVGTQSVGAGLDLLISAHYFQARILYLQGFADQARRIVVQNIAESEGSGQALTFCSVLGQGACPIALLAGDLDDAERHGRMLLAHTERFQIRLWNIWAGCFVGILAIRRGDIDHGMQAIRAGLSLAGEAQLLPRFMLIRCEYARYLGESGAADEALQIVEEMLAGCAARDEGWYVPELLRVQAELLLAADADKSAQAEALYTRSLAIAREQDARAWELRTGVSFARFLIQRQRREEATALLQSVLDRFPGASATDDGRAASALLASAVEARSS